MEEESSKIINFEDHKNIVTSTDEDSKKKKEKERTQQERKAQNDSILRVYKLGKYKNK